MQTMRRYLRWIYLTLVILSVPLALGAESYAASPTNHNSSQFASPSTVSDNDAALLDHCIVRLPTLPAYVTAAGRGVHVFHEVDEGIAPRLHRRVGMEAEPISLAPLPVSIGFQIRIVPMREFFADYRPVGRAPPSA
ncbi:MAG: hypothetical protein ACP5M4_14855 [Acidobacteriaceae bacterium]